MTILFTPGCDSLRYWRVDSRTARSEHVGGMMLRRGLVAFLCLGLASCGGYGLILSPQQSAADQDNLVLGAAPAQFVDGAMAAGATLGYQVTAVDRTANKVDLLKKSDLGTGVLIGKVSEEAVELTLQSDNRTVKIAVQMQGNFNTTDQAAAAKVIADFKAALTQRFAG